MNENLTLYKTTVIPNAIVDLQCLDCNCNDCIFMIRNIDKFKKSLEQHHKWQYDYFLTNKNKLVEKANFAKKRFNDLLKWNDLLIESEKLKFQFDKSECAINYGQCSKLEKEVSFIPNTLQLETQSCFRHRKLWNLK